LCGLQVFDFHAGQELDDGAPHSMIDHDAPLEWVEIPVEGSDAPCENPVARGDGAMYGSTEWQVSSLVDEGLTQCQGGERSRQACGCFGGLYTALYAEGLNQNICSTKAGWRPPS
jgi:hypothetical protein